VAELHQDITDCWLGPPASTTGKGSSIFQPDFDWPIRWYGTKFIILLRDQPGILRRVRVHQTGVGQHQKVGLIIVPVVVLCRLMLVIKLAARGSSKRHFRSWQVNSQSLAGVDYRSFPNVAAVPEWWSAHRFYRPWSTVDTPRQIRSDQGVVLVGSRVFLVREYDAGSLEESPARFSKSLGAPGSARPFRRLPARPSSRRELPSRRSVRVGYASSFCFRT
jgi:hypothetical protein